MKEQWPEFPVEKKENIKEFTYVLNPFDQSVARQEKVDRSLV